MRAGSPAACRTTCADHTLSKRVCGLDMSQTMWPTSARLSRTQMWAVLKTTLHRVVRHSAIQQIGNCLSYPRTNLFCSVSPLFRCLRRGEVRGAIASFQRVANGGFYAFCFADQLAAVAQQHRR